MRSSRRSSASTTFFALCAIGVSVYGYEHWRRRTSARVTTAEQRHFVDLTRCLLGPDGLSLLHNTDATRERLRTLAMATSLTPSPTWVDRCIPLARALVVHGATLDATRTVTAAPTQVARGARELALHLARTGLVWQVRAGDVSLDMDTVAELLVRTGHELALAGAALPRSATGDDAGVTAPTPMRYPRATWVAVPGAEPLTVGDPTAFLLGTPLPLLSVVRLETTGPRVEIRANTEARAWQLVPSGMLRIAVEDSRSDGLAPILLDTPHAVVGPGRVAPPPPRMRVAAINLDAVEHGNAMWVAESVLGMAPTLARLPLSGRDPSTAVRLAEAPPAPLFQGVAVRPSSDEAIADSVAVVANASTVFAAFVTRGTSDTEGEVHLVKTRDRATGSVTPLPFVGGPWRHTMRHPRVSLCQSGDTLWVVSTGRDQWRFGMLTPSGVTSVRSHTPRAGERLDDHVTVQCRADGVTVTNEVHGRTGPAVHCAGTGAGAGCQVAPPWRVPHSVELPAYETLRPDGEHVEHPEWPLRQVALRDGSFLGARASGAIVAVSRWQPGQLAWDDEQVVFDASQHEHGVRVTGLGLYSDGSRVLLAMATAEGVRLLRSADGGRTWTSTTESMAARVGGW